SAKPFTGSISAVAGGHPMSINSMTASGEFRVGDVMARAWRLFTGNVLFFVLVPVVIYVAMFVAFMIFGMLFAVVARTTAGAAFVGVAVGVIVALSFTMIGQGVLLLGAFQRLRGEALRVNEVLQRVVARLVPLFGMSVLWSVALVAVTLACGLVLSLLAM